MSATARQLGACACGLLWCDDCNWQHEREQVREYERERARALAATINQAFTRERITEDEARAIACGALALLAEATGLRPEQTVGTALAILLDVRAATDALSQGSVPELRGAFTKSTKPPPEGS